MRIEPIAPATAGMAAPAILPSPMEAQRLFISGHSLTDRPYPQQLAAIAASLGRPIQWNMQNQFGSTLRARTEGTSLALWSGYRNGTNRDGQQIDVLSELAHPEATDGHPYDTLLVTEQHTVLGNIVWNGTGRYLRDFHERMVNANPRAQTFLFASWLGVLDDSNPARWISYERAASPVWACVAEAINRSLAGKGRPDRIQTLPAALALAILVEKATGQEPVPGITGATPSATLKRLFRDDVHLTEAGSYYIALISYAFLYRRPPSSAWAPADLPEETAQALQSHAWDFTTHYLQNYRPLAPAQCSQYVSETFVPLYLSYLRDMHLKRDGSLRIWLQWARFRFEWSRLFRRQAPSNPLLVDGMPDRVAPDRAGYSGALTDRSSL